MNTFLAFTMMAKAVGGNTKLLPNIMFGLAVFLLVFTIFFLATRGGDK